MEGSPGVDTTLEANQRLEATRFLIGAIRKVAMARFHSREIGVLLDGPDTGEIALQAHFEGLVYAGVSAEEKLMRSLELLTAGETGARTNRVIGRLRGHSETERLGQWLARWAAYRFDDVNLVGEARAIRNVATHEFYDRRVGTDGDEWYFQVRRGRVVYSGSVRRFAAAYGAHVDELGEIAREVAAQFGLAPPSAPE
jgi:hypothetical protein